MPHYVFFSWQSDTPNRLGRTFVEACLERAIGELQADAEVDPADRDLAIDRDTLDVPGSPPIMETIFSKIDGAAVFLADLTYVAERQGGGRTPNPNVCIEHGYALKALSWRRVIAVMNTAMGHPDQFELPFDVRHTRRPIMFDLPEGADADAKRAARDGLVKTLKAALKAVLGDAAARAALAPAEPHPHDVELLGRVHRALPTGLRQFLHQHSFGTSYHLKTLNPIHEIAATWIGAAFEFHDVTVQDGFAEMLAALRALSELVTERTYHMPNSQIMAWAKTDEDARVGVQAGTLQAIRDMNTRATELSAAIDAFDRVSRDRIRTATGAHAEAAMPAAEGGAADQVRREASEAALNELALDANRGNLPEIVTRPRLTLRLVPFAAADGGRLEPRQVAAAHLRFPPNITDRVKADSDGGQWWSCREPRRPAPDLNPETTWLMRLVRPGHLEYQVTIGARLQDDPEILVDGRQLEALIVRTLDRMASILIDLGLGGGALASVVLDGVEDVQLTRARPGGRRIRRPDVYLPVVRIEDLAAPIAGALHEQLDILWQTSGWPDGSPSFEGGAWTSYQDERNYPA